jgi:hypothetical protein
MVALGAQLVGRVVGAVGEHAALNQTLPCWSAARVAWADHWMRIVIWIERIVQAMGLRDYAWDTLRNRAANLAWDGFSSALINCHVR